jgi:hypothetical protein
MFKQLLILLLLVGYVSADATINGPGQLSFVDPASSEEIYDGDTVSQFNTAKGAGNSATLIAKFNQTYQISALDFYHNGDYGMCSITEIYISSDGTTWGSNLVNTSRCPEKLAAGWESCYLTVTTSGQYFKAVTNYEGGGGVCNNGALAGIAYEMRGYGSYPPLPPGPVAGGPCRAYCDYSMTKTVPWPGDENFNVSKIWNVTITGTDTNYEGESYLNDTFSNVLITSTNGTKTGTCANHVPGAVFWVGRAGASGRNILIVNYTYGNVSDTTCAMTAPSITLCFNGTRQNQYSYTAKTERGNLSSSYAIVADSTKNEHYNLTYYNEASGGVYNFTGSTATATFYCSGAYEPFPVSLTVSQSSYVVQTKIKADIVTQINGVASRTYQTEGGRKIDQYLPNTTNSVSQYALQLYDYTGGQWYKSNLLIQSVVNNTQYDIDNASFSQDNLIYGWYQNGSRVKLTAKSLSGRTVNLGYITMETNSPTRNIILSTPIMNEPVAMYSDLIVTFTQDYASGQVGATVTTTETTSVSNFSVSNLTSGALALSYMAQGTGTTSFTYTLPDKSKTVQLELYLDSPKYGIQRWTKEVTLGNATFPLNSSAFGQPLPTTMLGSTSVLVKKLISVFLIIFIFFVFCKATDYGTGVLVGVGSFGFFWYIDWIPQSTIPFWFIAVMAFAAFMIKMFERRSY